MNSTPASAASRVADRAELLGYVPYLLGFHPADSIVLTGMRRRRIVLTARADAGWPTREMVRQFSRALRRLAGIDGIMLFGYGPPEAVDGPISTVADRLTQRGYRIRELLQVAGGRYRCLQCAECTPDNGAPFDVGSSAGAAQAVYDGEVVLPDRVALERSVSAYGEPAVTAMRQATDRAVARVAALSSVQVLQEGERAVAAGLRLAQAGRQLDEDAAAWLILLLSDLRVRDFAWKQTDDQTWQLDLWRNLTRRAEPALVAPVATLLAWCAWRRGDGALAMVALQRALRCDPGYGMAQLLDEALAAAVPPHTIPWP